MEAKTKIMAAVAVIVMCAAGLVGAGYAYTASTINEGNNATSEYVVLSQTGTGDYTFSKASRIYYDTVNREINSVATTTWTLNGGSTAIEGLTAYNLVQVGSPFTIQATQNTGDKYDLTCNVAVTGTIAVASPYVLILHIENNSVKTNMVYNGSSWSPTSFTIAKNGNAYYDTTVTAYYGYTAGSVITSAPETHPFNNVTLTFTTADRAAATTSLNVDFTTKAIDGQKLDTVKFNVTKANAADAILTTDYSFVWKNSQGTEVTPASQSMTTGQTYTLCITGAGTFANHYAEYTVTVVVGP